MPPRVTNRSTLQVNSSIWDHKITFKSKENKTVRINNYEEARVYAKRNGYAGIKILYV